MHLPDIFTVTPACESRMMQFVCAFFYQFVWYNFSLIAWKQATYIKSNSTFFLCYCNAVCIYKCLYLNVPNCFWLMLSIIVYIIENMSCNLSKSSLQLFCYNLIKLLNYMCHMAWKYYHTNIIIFEHCHNFFVASCCMSI